MLAWWQWAGVTNADLMVRRDDDGGIIWHTNRPLGGLYLSWLGYENAAGAEIYGRPARGQAWSVVMLDDVPCALAERIVNKYSALAVRTSQVGGCHIWLRTTTALDEGQRRDAQRYLATLARADRGSTSGEHLGRLAGFRNWKRRGEWVGVVSSSTDRPPWDASPGLARSPRAGKRTYSWREGAKDTSSSAADWAWTCGRLEAGVDPQSVREQLAMRARGRRGSDADRYARHTVKRAVAMVYGAQL
jgi:hypothetical protein